jgi:hypothetical protein
VDDTSQLKPVSRNPNHTGGLGIVLVHRLATAWGVQRHARHKTVWAELDLTRHATSGHAPHLSAVATAGSDTR